MLLILIFPYSANDIWYIHKSFYSTKVGGFGIKVVGNGKQSVISPVNLVKRPRISEATIPNFIDNLSCMGLISASWSSPDGKNRSSPYTLLVLLGQFPLTSSEEFP